MSGPLILSVDQGTTNSKALVIDGTGRVVSQASRPVPIDYPHPGWVEQDPRQVLDTVVEAVNEVLAGVERAPDVLAITNQRESVLLWDRATGEPVGPMVSWQCRRSSGLCERLRSEGAEDEVSRRTGLPLQPFFPAGKFAWLIDSDNTTRSRAEGGELCGGTVDSWLLWNLTGGEVHATDASNASRTQLYDIYEQSWNEELLELFSVPEAILPEVRPSSGVFGSTVAFGKLPAGIPVAAMVGDSHGALYGHGCHHPGPVKVTFGTGSSLMTVAPGPIAPSNGLSATIAWSTGEPVYALEANILSSGAAIEWMAEILGVQNVEEIEILADGEAASDGVFFVPALTGLGAPHWEADAQGLLVGMTRATNRSHLARAALESVAFQVRDVLDALETVAPSRDPAHRILYADGGASRSDLLMQIQADLTGWPVARGNSSHLAAVGAAYLAGVAMGYWSEEEVRRLNEHRDHFLPALAAAERDFSYDGWRDAVRRALPSPSEATTTDSEREQWPVSMS